MQRYGKDGGIDWDLNVNPEDIVEPSKTGQPTDPKDRKQPKDFQVAKENKVPPQETKVGQTDITSDKAADPEADIDSDEEAALREAGL